MQKNTRAPRTFYVLVLNECSSSYANVLGFIYSILMIHQRLDPSVDHRNLDRLFRWSRGARPYMRWLVTAVKSRARARTRARARANLFYLLRETCHALRHAHNRQIFWQRAKRVLLSPEFFNRSGRCRRARAPQVRMYPRMFFSRHEIHAISCSPPVINRRGFINKWKSRARDLCIPSGQSPPARARASIDQGRNVRFHFARSFNEPPLVCRSHYARHTHTHICVCVSSSCIALIFRPDDRIAGYTEKTLRYIWIRDVIDSPTSSKRYCVKFA